MSTLPGHINTLTPSETLLLQQTWIHLLRLCGINNGPTTTTATTTFSSIPNRTRDLQEHHLSSAAGSDPSADGVRRALWGLIQADHPDVAVLRFLRARKWDVDRATDMLVDALGWRQQQRVEEDVVREGDGFAAVVEVNGEGELERRPSASSSNQGLPEQGQTEEQKQFLAQYQSGKCYVRGTDREGRVVFVVRVKLHDPKKQTTEAMERFVLHTIETIRVMIGGSQAERACLVFDLSGFGLRNMDFHVVRFLAQVFEARYPEYLGVVLIHNAPFVFYGAWSIIKPWLDPVIASKINFTSGTTGLTAYIAPEILQAHSGGKDSWEYSYVPPAAGENKVMRSAEKKELFEAERRDLIDQFEQLTLEWVATKPGSAEATEKQEERKRLAGRLSETFWRLDPFVRARTYYHRVGVIGSKGDIDYTAAP
ncbi:CRAL-TRIO domain-containing protein [Chaetomium sp. MPI-SDFR-AT-0129]|nr:CRAL-TRIO domain-containing protein [Chaetomium sp. MPI-SDFR-AT-0129]